MLRNAKGELYLKGVIFDLDDTLVDSFAARQLALESVFQQVGIDAPTAQQFLVSLNGRQMSGTLEELAPGYKIDGKDLSDAYLDYYWNKEPGLIRLYPGIRSLLEVFGSHGIKMGVVTQKGREFKVGGRIAGTASELAELGVASLFSVVIGFEDVSRHKPDPEGVQLALKRLGVLPEEALLVGDSASDINAAREAGCLSCHCWSGGKEDARSGDPPTG